MVEKNNSFYNKKENNIIAISSGNGGIGKTWFSITLAHALASIRKKILFFDGDLGLNNISTQLGIKFNNNIDNIVNGDVTLNQVIEHCDKTKIDIISCSSATIGLSSVPIGRLQILGEDLGLLSSLYDRVIVDIGDCIERNEKILPGIARKIIVLCNNEPEVLTNTYSLIKKMTALYPKSVVNIVINQANSITEGKRAYGTLLSACQEYLNVSPSLLGIVRRDARVRDAIRNQAPMLNRYPTSEATEDVVSIARKIMEDDK